MKFVCTFEEYDRFEELFQSMEYQAGEYVPSDEDMEEYILPDLPKYVTFLLWIDLTGTEVEKNLLMRKRIHSILSKTIELVDELPEELWNEEENPDISEEDVE